MTLLKFNRNNYIHFFPVVVDAAPPVAPVAPVAPPAPPAPPAGCGVIFYFFVPAK